MLCWTAAKWKTKVTGRRPDCHSWRWQSTYFLFWSLTTLLRHYHIYSSEGKSWLRSQILESRASCSLLFHPKSLSCILFEPLADFSPPISAEGIYHLCSPPHPVFPRCHLKLCICFLRLFPRPVVLKHWRARGSLRRLTLQSSRGSVSKCQATRC